MLSNRFVGKEADLLEVIRNYGPVAVGVNAEKWVNRCVEFSQVLRDECEGNINHAALIVGYDVEGPEKYYIVQNSWGKHWGENGYVKVAYGQNAFCIAKEVSLVQMKWDLKWN